MKLPSIRTFMERFPTEQACRDYLFHIRWPRGFVCTKCGEGSYSYIRTRNLYECSCCKTQISITSNTAMHRTKLPLRYWLFTLYWVASGQKCSARKIALTLKLNYRTALQLLSRVRFAMFRGEFDATFAFWLPDQKTTKPIVKKVKALLLHKANHFIRKYYCRISDHNRLSYYYEYRFRNLHQHHPATAIHKLTTFVSSTIYTVHEYRIKFAEHPDD